MTPNKLGFSALVLCSACSVSSAGDDDLVEDPFFEEGEQISSTEQAISVPAGNLVANPSFETDLAGWKGWQGTLTRTTTTGSFGAYVAKVARTTGTQYTLDDTTPSVPVTTGTTYTGTAWVKAASSSAVGKPIKLVLRETSPSGVQVKYSAGPNVTLTNSFQQVSMSATATAGNSLDIYILQSSATTGDAFYADAIGLTSATQTTPPLTGWELVYEDNFDGTTLNTTTTDLSRHLSAWTPYNSAGHAGNGLRRASAITLNGAGNLVITAAKDSTGTIVSGGMSNRTSAVYGRYETRVRTEADSSGTMSGVVLTWPDSGGNLLNGENDFYETGHSAAGRNPFKSFVHWPNAATSAEQSYFIHQADASQWHVMVMEWTAATISIYRDGVLTGTLSEAGDPARNNIPDVMHHLCIQLDAFGTTLVSPVRMYVDYVRLYKKI